MRLLSIIFLLFSFFHSTLLGEENFLLIDANTCQTILEMGANVDQRTTPCSTFKIVLSLMGFDTRILKNQEEPVWDFQKGYVDYLDAWKMPQNPSSWIRNSCLWYSQILANRLGKDTIEKYLKTFNYGNQDISGGITKAWVSSSLRISPKEQVDFVQKLILKELPVSNKALEMTKAILFIDDLSGGWKLFGRTGQGSEMDREIGWFVGWIEKDDTSFVFAYNILSEKIVDRTQRILRVKQLLKMSCLF